MEHTSIPQHEIPVRFHWKAPEQAYQERSSLWYTGFAVFILGMILIGIVTQSWAMSLVFLLLAGIYVLVHMDTHTLLDIYVTDMGIQVGTKFFSYSEMTSFYLLYQPPTLRALHFVRRSRWQMPLVLQLGDQDPSPLVAYLSQQLPELAGVKERSLDRIIRLLKL